MKKIKTISLGLSLLLLVACQPEKKYKQREVALRTLKTFEVPQASIRAMVLMDGNIGFAGSKSTFGFLNVATENLSFSSLESKGITADFRSVGATNNDFFMLSAGNPALLLKTEVGQMVEVYREENDAVFYDSMLFLNDLEGIAVGDAIDGCMSVIRTNDGGKTWQKSNCESAPKLIEGEALFAASNSNIALTNKRLWVITGGAKSRIFYSDDKGKSWKSSELPIIQGQPSQGAFSVDFYDAKNGIVMGGDYQNPTTKLKTAAITHDGGVTWQGIESEASPGYVSGVKYIPETNGNELLSASPNGLWFSNDKGFHWQKIADEAFHSIQFVNADTFAASGNGKITLFRLLPKKK